MSYLIIYSIIDKVTENIYCFNFALKKIGISMKILFKLQYHYHISFYTSIINDYENQVQLTKSQAF